MPRNRWDPRSSRGRRPLPPPPVERGDALRIEELLSLGEGQPIRSGGGHAGRDGTLPGQLRMSYIDRGGLFEVMAHVGQVLQYNVRVHVSQNQVRIAVPSYHSEIHRGVRVTIRGDEERVGTIRLPEPVIPDKASSELWGQMLHIDLPKDRRKNRSVLPARDVLTSKR